jgi:hypothetical protein
MFVTVDTVDVATPPLYKEKVYRCGPRSSVL